MGDEWTEILLQKPLMGALPRHEGRRSGHRVAEVPCSFHQSFLKHPVRCCIAWVGLQRYSPAEALGKELANLQ